MINKAIAVKLKHRQELWHKTEKNADGTPLRCRVNGKCKVWKSKAFANEFELPVKYGLRQCFYITPRNGKDWEVAK